MSAKGGKEHQAGKPAAPLGFEGDAEATLALAHFGLRAGAALQEMAAPLEILAHLVYLAKVSRNDPKKLEQYLVEAQEVARGLTDAYAELLHAYPARRPRKTKM